MRVAQPFALRVKPAADNTSLAHARQSASPLCALLGAMVVVVVWDEGGDPVGPGYCDWPWEKRTDAPAAGAKATTWNGVPAAVAVHCESLVQ